MKKTFLILVLGLIFGFGTSVHAQMQCPSVCTNGCDPTTGQCVSAGYTPPGGTFNGSEPGQGFPGGFNGNSGVSGTGFPTPDTSGLESYASAIIDFINSGLVPLVISLAFIMFLWGVADAYILHPGSEEKRKEGHQFILWGIVGLVVIFSVWGLVNLVGSTLGLGDNSASTGYPQLPTL